ncbi:MAG: undecaprenyl-phosphate glucose phosphotransferase [Neptuniibacter sp.]
MDQFDDVMTVKRSLLQRRNSLSNTFQSLLDAFVVLSLFVLLAQYLVGLVSYGHVIFVLVLLGSMAVCYDFFGIYRRHRTNFGKSLDLLKAWSVSLVVSLGLVHLLQAVDAFPMEFLLAFAGLGFLLQLFSHLSLRRYHLARAQKSKVSALLIGEKVFSDRLQRKINSNPWVRERIVGVIPIVDDVGSTDGSSALACVQGAKKMIEEHDVRSVYLALPLKGLAYIDTLYAELMELNVDVHWVPNIHELHLINPSVKELSGYPVMTLSETPLIGTHHLKKAVVDKLLAVLALALLSWLMIGTALAIKLTSPGPVFFRQARTGWDGKEFKIWKFRSMKVHEEKTGEVKQATKNDDRITPVGGFIRKTSIDELPQLFNVLVGNMSMVGPRPHAVQHNQLYSNQITSYLCRHRIKPGITGLAQVRGFRGETEELELMSKRVESDLEYINNWSVTLDLIIMVRTALTLFSSRAY